MAESFAIMCFIWPDSHAVPDHQSALGRRSHTADSHHSFRDGGAGGRSSLCHARALALQHEVAGFKFATVGVIYAVLLAFAIVIVWERYNQADNEVANEASAAATVFRLTQGLDQEHGA